MTEKEIEKKEKNRESQITNFTIRKLDDIIQKKTKDELIQFYRNLFLNKNALNVEKDNLKKYNDLIHDILKNKLYKECGGTIKFQETEIDIIMNEAIEKNDFSLALDKLKEKEKNIFDYILKKKLKKYIINCENCNANNEIKEIKKLYQREEFDEIIKKYKNLLNNENLFEMLYKEYLTILKYFSFFF